ncbi:unnamed protein product [Peronospora effusa]|nr:unnamed protein product [Peronospora effusa]
MRQLIVDHGVFVVFRKWGTSRKANTFLSSSTMKKRKEPWLMLKKSGSEERARGVQAAKGSSKHGPAYLRSRGSYARNGQLECGSEALPAWQVVENSNLAGLQYSATSFYCPGRDRRVDKERLLVGKEFKIIEKFINKTNGGSKLSINTILKIARPEEDTHKDVLGTVDNHKLLWHGSRLSNFVGILSQGLRIAPPEAPRNGYQFGKGLYFADALAKSANYCCATSRNPTAVLLLADVALGTPYQIPTGEFLDYKMVKDQHGCDSTHGLGRMAPAENEFETLPDGVVVPAGTLKPVDGHQHLLYNEFIVYRREQVQLRYLVALDFQNLIQNGADYMVSRKWGRVGTKNPQRALERYNTSLEKAQASFMKKFLDKSGNEWPLTEPFKRVEGKYVFVELDEEVQEEGKNEVTVKLKRRRGGVDLAETVQNVLKLICGANVIAREVASMNLDLKRLPLGKLSKTQIRQGWSHYLNQRTTSRSLKNT